MVAFVILLLAGCGSNPTFIPEATQQPQPELWFTPTVVPTPPEVFTGNVKEPSINPLTGLPIEPQELVRRPVVVKIQNMPRSDRPQWGVSAADLVYEYLIEFGDTRFAAVYYGRLPEKVGPIRSARHVDIQIVQAYKAILVFGGAYADLFNLLLESDFGDRLIREGPNTAPALYRYDPEGRNYLLANLTLLDGVLEKYGIDNSPQPLYGMAFALELPEDGEDAHQIYVRFSGSVYNRWDYDVIGGRYLRYSDAANAMSTSDEQYKPLLDRGTEQQIAMDNVVVLMAEYIPLVQTSESEVFDIQLTGSGEAYLFRDGQCYRARWKRDRSDDLLTLWREDGQPLPFRPGQTWFEVLGRSSKVWQGEDGVWRFEFWMP
ncbi:MAG: DUF3048 domain-containing protein [Anaerolineales bacterium]